LISKSAGKNIAIVAQPYLSLDRISDAEELADHHVAQGSLAASQSIRQHLLSRQHPISRRRPMATGAGRVNAQ
jgi:hypothetical protein